MYAPRRRTGRGWPEGPFSIGRCDARGVCVALIMMLPIIVMTLSGPPPEDSYERDSERIQIPPDFTRESGQNGLCDCHVRCHNADLKPVLRRQKAPSA